MKPDVSRGIDPVPAVYDIRTDMLCFREGIEVYRWPPEHLPFTLVEVVIDGRMMRCADRSWVIKHALNAANAVLEN